jgi:predicted TIM-barrel fold metal-dependent hydrolase
MSPGDAITINVDDPLPVFTADFSIDAHSHIQSGATAPLPLIWKQMLNIKLNRTVLDALGGLFIRGGKIQRKTTEEIADDLVRELGNTYVDNTIVRHSPYKAALAQKGIDNTAQSIFTPCIIMPMDMDYAHLAGFYPESTTIYHEAIFEKNRVLLPDKKVDGVYYHIREKATDAEIKGKIKDVSKERPENVWVYQAYKKQNDSTIAAVKKHPWTLIPMFHYDPRRWCNPTDGDMDNDNWVHGPWDFPFQHIATAQRSGLFIGFKMYPPLGYKPLDHRLECLENFYARCEDEQIPILTHCSPGGMTTHEAEFYQEKDGKVPSKEAKKEGQSIDKKRSLTYDPLEPEGYFFDEYVHPKNWRPVLERFPKLKLCLAHLGGSEWDKGEKGKGLESDWVKEIIALTQDFPNVYTDMACFDIEDSWIRSRVMELFRRMKYSEEYQHLQDRLNFGVDWYLSLITKAPAYREFAELFFESMGEFDQWQWYRSALVNPAMFYGLDKKEIIENMQLALMGQLKTEMIDAKRKLNENFIRISKVPEQIEVIRKQLAK